MEAQTASRVATAASALALLVLTGCASLSPEERDAKRAELDAMGERAISKLLESKPEARESLDNSLGYVVLDMTVAKVPMVGAGTGTGVVIDKRNGNRSYIKVSRFEIGSGWGAQKFKLVIILFDEKLLENAFSGSWHFNAGAEASAGTARAEGGVSLSDEGFEAYRMAEEGAVATVTVRVAYAEPYLE